MSTSLLEFTIFEKCSIMLHSTMSIGQYSLETARAENWTKDKRWQLFLYLQSFRDTALRDSSFLQNLPLAFIATETMA